MNTSLMRFGILFMLLLLQISMAGCGVRLNPDAQRIYVVNNTQEVSACTPVGHVSAKSMSCMDPSSCMYAASAAGRNQAAKLGATHLMTTFNGINLTHGLYEGDAYKCDKDKVGVQRMEIVTPAPATGGCAKDTDCKGDRVCEDSRCVPPVGVKSL